MKIWAVVVLALASTACSASVDPHRVGFDWGISLINQCDPAYTRAEVIEHVLTITCVMKEGPKEDSKAKESKL